MEGKQLRFTRNTSAPCDFPSESVHAAMRGTHTRVWMENCGWWGRRAGGGREGETDRDKDRQRHRQKERVVTFHEKIKRNRNFSCLVCHFMPQNSVDNMETSGGGS